MNAKRHPMVEVVWHDAHSDGGGWKQPTEALRDVAEPYVVRSVGFLLKANKREVVVAQSRTDRAGYVTDTMTIPRGMVRRVRRLV